tara:strand:- start:238 stop:618 length:381 start_codon:yes stop_codon:yes gene_type:complete
MSSTVKANKWLHSDGTETTEVDVPSLDQRMAKAWVTFDEVNNVIRDSYNVSSLTDVDNNNMKVNLAITMSNVHYAIAATAAQRTSNPADHTVTGIPLSTTQFQLEVYNTVTAVVIDDYVSAIVFGS